MIFDIFPDLPYWLPLISGMMTAKDGRPGSGKTHDAVKNDLLPALKQGRRVYCNIDGLNTKECQLAWKEIYGLTDEQIKNFHFLENDKIKFFWDFTEPGSLIIIDEVQRHFDSKDYMSEANKQFGKWASTHRHFGYDVVLITQQVGRIEKSARDLIDFTYRFFKIRALGKKASKFYKCEFYQGPDVDGFPPLKSELRPYDRKIFPCYESYVNKIGEKFDVSKSVNVFMHPVFFAIPICLAVVLYYGYRSFQGDGIAGYIDHMNHLEEVATSSPLAPVSEKVGISTPVVPDPAPDSAPMPDVQSPPPRSDQAETQPQRVKIGEINGKPIYSHGGLRYAHD